MFFDNPKHLCHSFNGPERPRSPRLFEPLEQDEFYPEGFAACDCCGINIDTIKIRLCAACHEKEKSCNSQETSKSAKTAASSASTGACISKPTPSSTSLPLASSPKDTPEGRGWARFEGSFGWIEHWKRENCQLNFDGKYWYGYRGDKGLINHGVGNGVCGDPFKTWQEAHDLLFQKEQRAFKLGDLVECLLDEEWIKMGSFDSRKEQLGKRATILSFNPVHKAVVLDGLQYHWPVRSLRLIEAAKE